MQCVWHTYVKTANSLILQDTAVLSGTRCQAELSHECLIVPIGNWLPNLEHSRAEAAYVFAHDWLLSTVPQQTC